MADYLVRLTAGEQVDLTVRGNYYRVMDASNELYIGVDGGPLQLRGQGVGEKVEQRFDRLTLVSDTTQLVRISVTHGRIDDNRLSLQSGTVVQVDNGVIDSSATVAGSTDAPNGVSIEIIAPSANVNGVRVFGINLFVGLASVTRFYAATQMIPAGPFAFYAVNGVYKTIALFEENSLRPITSIPVVIKPGDGVYVTTSGLSSPFGEVSFGTL